MTPPSGGGRGARRARSRVRSGLLVVAGVLAPCSLLVVPGVRHGLRTATVTPVPGFVPGVVDVLVAVVNGMRAISPFVALAALAVGAVVTVTGRRSGHGRTIRRLSRAEYAGVDHLDQRSRPRAAPVRAVRELVAGTGLAVLAIVLIGATSGIEHEISNGPLRPVDALTDALSGPLGTDDVSYVLQSRAITFMDDSAIAADQLDLFATTAPVPVIPFGKHLFTIDDRSALELSVPDALYARLAGAVEPTSCAGRTIVVDDTVGARPGDSVAVNGVALRVAAVRDGMAQMNRSIGILAESTVRACISNGTTTAWFGALVGSTDTAQVDRLLTASGIEAVAVGRGDFRENNRDFWRANATPLLLQLILYIALFSAFAAANERRSALQRNVREIGMLHASGVEFGTLRAIERLRALRTTLRATALAAPLMVPVAAAFNASELGVRISVGLTELSVGFSLTLVAMTLASHRALTQFRTSLDLPLAVKG